MQKTNNFIKPKIFFLGNKTPIALELVIGEVTMAHSSNSGNLKNGLIDFTAGSLGTYITKNKHTKIETISCKKRSISSLY